MDELRREIEMAYNVISAMAVKGDNQDRAAVAKDHLRRAFKLAEERKEADADGGQDDR